MFTPATAFLDDGRQRFQWSSGGDVVEVLAELDPETNKSVIFLDDIQLAFHGAQYIRSGTMVVPYLRDKSRKYLEPRRIEYRPQTLLHVIAVSDRPASSNTPSTSTVQSSHSVSSSSAVSSSIAPPTSKGAVDAWLLNGIAQTLEEVRDDQQKNHAVTVDMLKTTHNWLALILDRANAIFQLTYELHEYPIPRLFVILPGRNSFKDKINPLVDKYRLYFLCECDVSAKEQGQRNRPHIHFAKHDGYDLERPTEFFKKYGNYVLTLLQLLRFSVAATSFVVPHIAGVGRGLEKGIQEIENAAKKQLTQKVDQAIEFLKDLPSSDQMEGGDDDDEKVEALEGADLRHLASFLKNKDETRVLGNLYRLARPNGTVKWVCLDHYREEYKRTEVKQFSEFVQANNGNYFANEGKVEIRLKSKMIATQFYQHLPKAKFIHELVVALDWNATLDDFKDLRSVMESLPTVLSLTVDCCNAQSRVRDLVSRGTPARVLAQTMTGYSLQTFAIRNCSDFLSQVEKFPTAIQLRKIDLGACFEGRTLKENLSALVKKSPRLRHLSARLPNLESAAPLLASSKLYQFQGASVMELHIDTGETISAGLQEGVFTEISMRAMDCAKDLTILPFVTKLFTKISPETNLEYLVDYFRGNTQLKEIDIEVGVMSFVDIISFLCQSSKDIQAAFLHDEENSLRMNDIRDHSTAEVDLLYDTTDFERLFRYFGAIPRYVGAHVAMTNEIVAVLEERTRLESRLKGLWVDVSILDDYGIDNIIAIIQRSLLKELSIRSSNDINGHEGLVSQDKQKVARLVLAVIPFLKDAHLHLRCRAQEIVGHYKETRDLFSEDENCLQLSFGDGTNFVVIDGVHNSNKADVAIMTDDVGVSLEEFHSLFGALPCVLGQSQDVTNAVVTLLGKDLKENHLREFTVNPSTLNNSARAKIVEIISRSHNLSVVAFHCQEERILDILSWDSLLSQVIPILKDTELRVSCAVDNFVQMYHYLAWSAFATGPNRRLTLWDGPNFICFEDIQKPLANQAYIAKDFADSLVAWNMFGVLPMQLGFSFKITDMMASTMEALTQFSPSLCTDIRLDTSRLTDEGLQNMTKFVSRSQLATLNVYCSDGDAADMARRDSFILSVLPYLINTEVFVHCRVKEFLPVFELLRLGGPINTSGKVRYLCDGDRYLVTTNIFPLEPAEMKLRGKGGVKYRDRQHRTAEEGDELGDVLQMGSSLLHLDTNSFIFMDKDALQLDYSTTHEGSRLKALTLSSSYLSKAGYDNMQRVIDRSGPLSRFTFICGSDSYFTDSKAVLEMLMRNQGDVTELIQSDSRTRSWIPELHHLMRADWSRLTSFQFLSDSFGLSAFQGNWIRSMVMSHSGVQPLTKIRLCNVYLPAPIWEFLIRDMEKAMLEELDLEGSNITEELALVLIFGFNSQSRLKRLNLKRTQIGPQFKTTNDLSTFKFEIEVDPLPLPTPPPQLQTEYSPPGMQSSFPWNPYVEYAQTYDHDHDPDRPLVPPGAPKLGHLQPKPTTPFTFYMRDPQTEELPFTKPGLPRVDSQLSPHDVYPPVSHKFEDDWRNPF